MLDGRAGGSLRNGGSTQHNVVVVRTVNHHAGTVHAAAPAPSNHMTHTGVVCRCVLCQ